MENFIEISLKIEEKINEKFDTLMENNGGQGSNCPKERTPTSSQINIMKRAQ